MFLGKMKLNHFRILIAFIAILIGSQSFSQFNDTVKWDFSPSESHELNANPTPLKGSEKTAENKENVVPAIPTQTLKGRPLKSFQKIQIAEFSAYHQHYFTSFHINKSRSNSPPV